MKNICTKQKVARAQHDLRLGIPLIISAYSKKYLVNALETISEETFSIYQDIGYEIILPAIRAKSLWDIDTKYELRCKLHVTDSNLSEVIDLTFDDINLPSSIDITQSFSEDISMIKFIKGAELFPCVIVSEIKDSKIIAWCDENKIVNLDVDDIANYADFVEVQEVCKAPLVLNGAEEASIIVYRCLGKEHYAIIIGNPLHQQEPLVRIHSSCYTGDLLDSLTCDCGGQLKDAINFMAKNNGGIILYLSQEGRGIGLTNKLRTYYQQAYNNFDTVDANRVLGFADDERDFRVAAEMLKNLNILSVKLVTNNQDKILQLKAEGINVSSYINSKIKYNKYNMHYLHTKFNKMGHIINY